jgi:hypothetical protein
MRLARQRPAFVIGPRCVTQVLPVTPDVSDADAPGAKPADPYVIGMAIDLGAVRLVAASSFASDDEVDRVAARAVSKNYLRAAAPKGIESRSTSWITSVIHAAARWGPRYSIARRVTLRPPQSIRRRRSFKSHCGDANISETSSHAFVSVRLALLKVASDNITETGHEASVFFFLFFWGRRVPIHHVVVSNMPASGGSIMLSYSPVRLSSYGWRKLNGRRPPRRQPMTGLASIRFGRMADRRSLSEHGPIFGVVRPRTNTEGN